MKEQEKPIYPTQEEAPIPYIIQFPDNAHLTEIDCLGLSPRVRNALLRSRIREIAQLVSLSDVELLKLRKIGQKSLGEIHERLGNFFQMLIEEQTKKPGKAVIIEVFPPPTRPTRPEKWIKKWTPVINFVRTWQDEHPGKWGALTTAAEHFEITRERVRQIVTKYQQLTGESLKPERVISLYEIACQIGVKPKVLLRLLKDGKITFSENIDPFLTKDDISYNKRVQKRVIPLSSVNIERIRSQLTRSVEEIMKSLTRSKARTNEDILPLSKIIREVKPKFNNRQVRTLYEKLVALGFHIAVFPAEKRGYFYYFVHRQEAPKITKLLKEKGVVWKSHKNRAEIVFGPSDSSVPSTTQLFRKEQGFISVYAATSRTLERKYSLRFLQKILKIIFAEEQPSFPIYRYPKHRGGHAWRINLEDLSAFETLLKAKKEEIIRFLENPKDYPTSHVQF